VVVAAVVAEVALVGVVTVLASVHGSYNMPSVDGGPYDTGQGGHGRRLKLSSEFGHIEGIT